MPAPGPRIAALTGESPPMLPSVVVVHPADVESGAAAEPAKRVLDCPLVPEDSLLAEDAIARKNGPTAELDRVQESVMAAISPDGRPPHRDVRAAEWKWVLAGLSVLLVGAVVLVAMSSIAWPTVAFGVVIVLVLMGAAIPTWGAGLLRGGEEKRARVSALRQEERDRMSR